MLNFDTSMTAHMSWKMRLRKFITGQSDERFDIASVRQDNQCELGQWLHGEGAKHSACEEYKRLKTIHADFHKSAAKVLETFSQGHPAAANDMLNDINGEFTRHSADCLRAIKELKTAIGK